MNSIAIPISFCLLSSILLWFVIGSRGNWLVKALMTIVCVYFGVIIWFSLYTYLGWPSKDSLPKKYVVYWAQIEEPDPNSEGAIYIWVNEIESDSYKDIFYILKYSNKKNEPRVYQIPYSKSLHENTQQMMEEIKKGSVYIGGEVENNKSKGKIGENNPLKGKFGFSHKSKDQYLFPLPPPKIPEKLK